MCSRSGFPRELWYEIPVAWIDEKLQCPFLDPAANWKEDIELRASARSLL